MAERITVGTADELRTSGSLCVGPRLCKTAKVGPAALRCTH